MGISMNPYLVDAESKTFHELCEKEAAIMEQTIPMIETWFPHETCMHLCLNRSNTKLVGQISYMVG